MGWGEDEDEDEDEGKRRPRKDMGVFSGSLAAWMWLCLEEEMRAVCAAECL